MSELGIAFRYRDEPRCRVLALRWEPGDPTARCRMRRWLTAHGVRLHFTADPADQTVMRLSYRGGWLDVRPGYWVLLDDCPHALTDRDLHSVADPEET